MAFVAQGEAAVAAGPGVGSFDLPAVTGETFAGLQTAAGDTWGDPSFTEPGSELVLVIAFVRGYSLCPPGGRRRRGPRRERMAAMACTSGLSAWLSCTLAPPTAQPERQAVGVGEDVDLRSVLAVIDRVRPGQGPPFSGPQAGLVHDRCRPVDLPGSPVGIKDCPMQRGPIPQPRSRPRNRRCAVCGDTSEPGGRCRHAQPVVSTNTITLNTARSSIGAVPPPWRRGTKPRYQRLDHLPQRVRNQPQRQRLNHSHNDSPHQSQQTHRPTHPPHETSSKCLHCDRSGL